MKKEKTLDITIDFETCGTCPTAAVMSVGAVAWNRYADDYPFGTVAGYPEMAYGKHVDLRSSFLDGFTFDGETAKWWAGQSDEAKAALLANDETPAMPIEDVTLGLCSFIEEARNIAEADDVCLWSQGSDFDIAILRNICRKYGIGLPVRHFRFRDHRTFFMEGARLICDLTGTEFNPRDAYKLVDEYGGQGQPHSPVFDCKRSIYSTWQMMKHLRCLSVPSLP